MLWTGKKENVEIEKFFFCENSIYDIEAYFLLTFLRLQTEWMLTRQILFYLYKR